jgi:hypothetical protein
MIVGSFSSNFYSIPRATKDADMVIQVTSDQRKRLIQKLPAEMEVDPQMFFETATATTKTLIYVPSIAFEIELFDLSDDDFDRSRFGRRVKLDFNGNTVYLPTAEDVIIQKLRWYVSAKRAKDLEDAKNVYLTQKEYLDLAYIEKWANDHDSREVLNTLGDYS